MPPITLSGTVPASSRTSGPQRRGPDQHAVADYIHDLSEELSDMAGQAGLELLSYLLNVVQIEAEAVKRRTGLISASAVADPLPTATPTDSSAADEPQG